MKASTPKTIYTPTHLAGEHNNDFGFNSIQIINFSKESNLNVLESKLDLDALYIPEKTTRWRKSNENARHYNKH